MRAYYDVMADWQQTNQVDLHNLLGYCYWIGPGSFPRTVLHQMQTHLQAAQTLATNWYVLDRLNDASNAWWYCCTNQGITDPSALTNFSGIAAVPSSGTFTVNLGGMVKYWPTRSVSGYYYDPAYFNNAGVTELDFNGAALNFAAAGNYRVDVISYCRDTINGWPSQKVYLGGVCSGAISITNTTSTTNSFVMAVPAATALDLVVSQDDNGRFLRVKSITLTKQ